MTGKDLIRDKLTVLLVSHTLIASEDAETTPLKVAVENATNEVIAVA